MTTLTGHGVTLEPLVEAHLDELVPLMDDESWRYTPMETGPFPRDAATHRAWLARWWTICSDEEAFAVRRLHDGALVGSTRYLNIATSDRRREIGKTFYGATARATGVNAACKRLLFGHAFDELGCVRVELRCDARNAPSRAAIARLGAVEEATLRRHRVLRDGFIRDTVVFSVVDHDWPAVRDRLDARLARRPVSPT